MKQIIRGLAVVALVSAAAVATDAQGRRSQPSLEQIERATTVFATILKSDERARAHVKFLVSYAQGSPWSFELLASLTQRLAVAGFSVFDVDETLMPCGDMALAIDADDTGSRFEQIVVAINLLSKERQARGFVSDALDDLRAHGVPVFDLLGEATGMAPEKVEQLARAERIRGPATKRLLLEAFTRRYGGLAARLTEKKREKN